MRSLALALLVAIAGLAGPAAASDGRPFTVGAFTFRAPAGWEAVPPASPMRKAELRIPDPAGGAPGSCTFFHFGAGQGGTAEANIERWYGQFQEPRDKLDAKVVTEQGGATKLHFFRASGTFLSGMPGGPQTPMPGHTLLGAVLESPDGHVFVRCVAADKLAAGAEPGFVQLVKSPFGR